MSIQVVCPNGHVLKVKSKYGGKVGFCPFCNSRLEIPDRKRARTGQPRESSLSGLSINMPDDVKDWKPPSDADDIEKICAKCHKGIPQDAAVCPHCHTYIARLLD